MGSETLNSSVYGRITSELDREGVVFVGDEERGEHADALEFGVDGIMLAGL